MLDLLLKSVIDSDNAAVVICDLNSVIVYMNPAAVSRYHKDLTGKSLKDCHNAKSNEMIDRVLGWFKKSPENNIMYTYYNEKENKDVYMVALRDADKNLIGYYEKHELFLDIFLDIHHKFPHFYQLNHHQLKVLHNLL